MERSKAHYRLRKPIGTESTLQRQRPHVYGETEQAGSPDLVAAELAQLKQLAWLMDESIPIPMTGMKVGIDGLIGLIPGIGDLISAGIASYIVARANQLGVPRVVLARMAGNVLIDAVIGAVPLVGDIFDFAWKANRRNLDLLVKHVEAPRKTTRSSWWVVAGLIGIVLAAFVGFAALLGAIFAAILR